MCAIHVSVILASSRKLSSQLYAHELATLASDGADESDGAKHVARHIDHVSHFQIGDVHAGGCRCCRRASERLETGFALNIGGGGAQ